MPITFEQVSYSYKPGKADKQSNGQNKAQRSVRMAGTRSKKNNRSKQVDVKKAAWGNEPDALWALKDINFELEEGEFFGIAGHTGSGKSTLLQHMNGLIHPTRGRVLVDGQDISDKKMAAEARSKVGLVFQYPEHQLFANTVYEDIAFGPRNMELSADEVDRRIREALLQVSLDFDDISQKSPFELSGGQQRRVAFAGVLSMRPKILILDEPVAGLDPVSRVSFLDFVYELYQQGLTVVMVSHSMNDLARLCDRILVLKEGEQFMLGTPDEIFTQHEALNEVGLSAPSAQRLADLLMDEGLPLQNTSLYDADGLADDLAALYKG